MKVNYEVLKGLEKLSMSELGCLIKKARDSDFAAKDPIAGRESKSDKKQREGVLP